VLRALALLNVPLLYIIITSHNTSDFPIYALSSFYTSTHFTSTVIQELSPATFLTIATMAPCRASRPQQQKQQKQEPPKVPGLIRDPEATLKLME